MQELPGDCRAYTRSMRRVPAVALSFIWLVAGGAYAAPAAGGRGARGTGIFDIPIGKLLIAWAIAAAIGAAGGAVYAGIMGPPRDRRME